METSTDVSAEAIRTQLDRILASPGFVHSERMARFLRFAVEQTLQGHADSLKESVLGMEVFDRTTSFDPRTDTIVRVEARRLRSKLKEYYETHGQHDAVLIQFPKGSYVPTFLTGNGAGNGKLTPSRSQAGLVDEAKSSNEAISTRRFRIPSPGIALALGFGLVMVTVGLTLWLTRTPAPVHFPKLTRLTSDLGLTYQPTVSRDGKFLAYTSDRSGEGNLDIWVKPVAGGEPARLTWNQADDHEPAFSPDGSKVVFRSERNGGGIYAVSVLGGEERLIAAKGRQPRFSPDGTQIAFWTGIPAAGGYGRARGVIYLIPSSGGAPRELEPRFSVARSPVWSPDGTDLLFLGLRDEQFKSEGKQEKDGLTDWWVVSLDGKVAARTGALDLLGQHDLSPAEPEPGDWVATPEGDVILFARTIGEATNVWQVTISPKTWHVTGPPRRLTSGTATETHPSLSVRGLVFAGLASNSDIWSLPIDATHGKPLGPLQPLVQSAAEDIHSSLSGDGKTLAWNSGRSGYPDIWVKDLESGRESAITEGPREEDRVLLSPEASKLAYMVRNGAQVDFYLAELGKGSSAERLCENCGGAMLDWSPDGTELLYWWGNPVRFSMLNIASRKSQIVLQHAKYDLHRGQISPDGRWLAFSIPVESQSYQALIAPLRKTDPPGENEWIHVATDAGCPHWSPDGNLLYFLSTRDGFCCFWAQALEPQTKRPVGAPIEVLHFHSARRSLTNTLGGTIGISLTSDRMVFSMKEVTGNIWLAEME